MRGIRIIRDKGTYTPDQTASHPRDGIFHCQCHENLESVTDERTFPEVKSVLASRLLSCSMHWASHAMPTGSYCHMVCLPVVLSSFLFLFVCLFLSFFLSFFAVLFPLTKLLSFLYGRIRWHKRWIFWGYPARNPVWAQAKLTESLVGFRRAFQVKGVAPLSNPRSHVPQSLLICCARFHRVDYWTKQLLQFARRWYITHEWSVSLINCCLCLLLTGSRYID